MPGLHVRVGLRTKVFWLIYRQPSGTTRREKIGAFPAVSLKEAQTKARALRVKIDRAEEPSRKPRSSAPFTELVNAYIEHRRVAGLADRTVYDYRQYLRIYIAETALGRRAAGAVRAEGIQAFLDGFSGRSKVQANRTFALLRATCRWAVSCRPPRLEHNPVEGMARPYREHARQRVLDSDEVGILWGVLEAQPLGVAGVLRLQLLLGQRPTETLRMRWRNLDLSENLWEIPGEDRKDRRSHVVPLSSAALEVLGVMPRQTRDRRTGGRVFPLNPGQVRLWWGPVQREAMARGCDHFTRHDLRSTCATGCAKYGKASTELVSRILGHATPRGTSEVTGRYDLYDRLDERRAALEAWGRHLESVCGGEI